MPATILYYVAFGLYDIAYSGAVFVFLAIYLLSKILFLVADGWMLGKPGALQRARSLVLSVLCAFLLLIGMVAVVLAAVIYAAGQVGGTEFRASAGRWATALLVGAVLSLILILLLPLILAAFDPDHADQYVINCV